MTVASPPRSTDAVHRRPHARKRPAQRRFPPRHSSGGALRLLADTASLGVAAARTTAVRRTVRLAVQATPDGPRPEHSRTKGTEVIDSVTAAGTTGPTAWAALLTATGPTSGARQRLREYR